MKSSTPRKFIWKPNIDKRRILWSAIVEKIRRKKKKENNRVFIRKWTNFRFNAFAAYSVPLNASHCPRRGRRAKTITFANHFRPVERGQRAVGFIAHGSPQGLRGHEAPSQGASMRNGCPQSATEHQHTLVIGYTARSAELCASRMEAFQSRRFQL